MSIVKYQISKEDLLLYKDILESIKTEEIVAIDTQTSQPHDKTIKKILEDKKEVSKFLKEYIGIDEKIENLEEYKIEKCRTSKEIRNVLIEILQNTKDEKTIEWIKDMLYGILSKKLNEEGKEEIKRILREMEEKKMDDEFIERINEGDAKEKAKFIKQGEKNGIKTAIKQIIKNMLKFNQDEETIMKFTNAKKEEIEKVRKELQVQM